MDHDFGRQTYVGSLGSSGVEDKSDNESVETQNLGELYDRTASADGQSATS